MMTVTIFPFDNIWIDIFYVYGQNLCFFFMSSQMILQEKKWMTFFSEDNNISIQLKSHIYHHIYIQI